MRLVVLIAALVLAGCSSPPPPATPPAGSTYSNQLSLPPRGSTEVNFEMEAGARIHVLANASAAVAWDIHSHPGEGNEVTQWRNGEDRVIDVEFEAPTTDVYSVYFESKSGGTTIVRVNLTGEFELVE